MPFEQHGIDVELLARNAIKCIEEAIVELESVMRATTIRETASGTESDTPLEHYASACVRLDEAKKYIRRHILGENVEGEDVKLLDVPDAPPGPSSAPIHQAVAGVGTTALEEDRDIEAEAREVYAVEQEDPQEGSLQTPSAVEVDASLLGEPESHDLGEGDVDPGDLPVSDSIAIDWSASTTEELVAALWAPSGPPQQAIEEIENRLKGDTRA